MEDILRSLMTFIQANRLATKYFHNFQSWLSYNLLMGRKNKASQEYYTFTIWINFPIMSRSLWMSSSEITTIWNTFKDFSEPYFLYFWFRSEWKWLGKLLRNNISYFILLKSYFVSYYTKQMPYWQYTVLYKWY